MDSRPSTRSRAELAARAARVGRIGSVSLLLLCVLTAESKGQGVVERPGDVVPKLPAFEDEVDPPRILPPILPRSEVEQGEESALRIEVRAFAFEGNTVFGSAALAALVRPFTERILGASDLRRARDAITRHYVDAGYLNSGATLPDQPVRDGVVRLRIIEGRLSDVKVSGERHYQSGYLRGRLLREVGRPLRLSQLEQAIRGLQQEDGIGRVDASLRPGLAPGEAVLELSIEEANAISGRIQADNDRPPSVGEIGGRIGIGHGNLLGRDDRLTFDVSGSEGLVEVAGRYTTPVADTAFRLGGHTTWTEGRVVESEFEDLDIEVESLTAGFSLHRPLLARGGHRLSSTLVAEWRRSRTRVLGMRFDFPGSGTDRGDATVSVLRGSLDWTYRDRVQAFAARSTLSWGLDILGATSAPSAGRDASLGELPNGRFLSWLTQLQWARRLPLHSAFHPVAQLRFDAQLSSDPLLPFERLSIGGGSSVRGFRENQIVADQGVIGTAELRMPVPWRSQNRQWLFLTPFYDIGHGWNRDRQTPGRTTLQSVGVSLEARPLDWLRGEVTMGWPIDGNPKGDTLQERGVNFRVEMQF